MRRKHGIGFITFRADLVEERTMLDRLRHQGIVLPTDEQLNATIKAFVEEREEEMLKRQRLLAQKDGG